MKKSEMNDIQKANYEYMRSLGIKKSWAKRLVSDGSFHTSEEIGTEEAINDIVLGFDGWSCTKEGSGFWAKVEARCPEILFEMSYHAALLEISNELVQKAE
jgi:hypothetical protein